MGTDGGPRGSKIGIMGGTFDPIHYGHLFIAEAARRALCLDRLIFVPAGAPPHKQYEAMAPAEDRYAMTALAIKDNPRFEISRVETDKTGASYTSETLETFAGIYAGARFFLIMGMDSALEMTKWHDHLKILSLAAVVVVARPGYIRDKIEKIDETVRKSLIFLDVGMIDVSSTEIRVNAREGKSVRYMTPEAVGDYVRDMKLYSGTEAR
ncbi:MAG: nicotinate-nucleotide adenylyltransferase [Synergistaceae bacterium]|jgi:nicotinate-nucleotide adenylyltransferase|nr:nicotinate-nucleotide adenylyltransferase [Synergistaceae bacterium]